MIERDSRARLERGAVRFGRRVLATGTGASLIAVGIRLGEAAEGTPAATAGREVETIHGPVAVPAEPERIVAVNFPSVLALLELGVMPVGITSYLPALPPGSPDISGIAVIDNDAGELELETIIALEPDLIVGSDWGDPAQQFLPYDELSRIAPTALFEWQTAAGNWEVEAAGVAEAIGKSAELAQLREDYEQRAETIRTTYAEALQAATWDLISASDSNWYLYGPTSSHGKVAIAAGVTLGAAADQTEGYTENSFERFDLLAQTGALLVRSAGDEGLQVLANVDTYQGLPAVRSDQVFTSDYFFPSSYGLSEALLADIETGLQALQG